MDDSHLDKSLASGKVVQSTHPIFSKVGATNSQRPSMKKKNRKGTQGNEEKPKKKKTHPKDTKKNETK